MGLISLSHVSEAAHRVGLRVCALGWHRRPLEEMPCPRGVPKSVYRLNLRYRCPRCGLVGRRDSYGNLAGLDEDETIIEGW
jgi:hypothetical protein